MKNKLSLLIIFAIIIGCGGSTVSDKSNQDPKAIISTSQLGFYVPQWFDISGKVIITDVSGTLISEINTRDINLELLSVPSTNEIIVHFIPETNLVICPNTLGCGETLSESAPKDNGTITFGETFIYEENFSAKIFLSPGKNTVYFSLLSEIEAEFQITSHLASMTVTPNYHQTFVDEENSQDYINIAKASHFVLLSSKNQKYSYIDELKSALVYFSQEQKVKPELEMYISEVIDYLRFQVLSATETETTSLIKVQSQLFQLLNPHSETEVFKHSQTITDRVLLEQFRDILGLVQIHNKKYDKDLNNKIAEINNIVSKDAEPLVNVLSEVLSEVLTIYSPLGELPEGTYRYQNLNVIYSTGPFYWQISGLHQGVNINIDINIPKWRVSALRGDMMFGNISATITNNDNVLIMNAEEFFIQFDGIDDAFNEDKAKTAIAVLKTSITIKNSESELTGYLSVNVNHLENDSEQIVTNLSAISFLGYIESDIQSTNFLFYSADRTPYVDDLNENMVYSVIIDMPISGAPDFRLSMSGRISDIQNLTNIMLSLKMKGRIIEIESKQEGDINHIKIKGLDGRWLNMIQNGDSYTGSLYFGDVKIGDIKTVKGIPGIIFPDGTFESLI
jgi:hypothetical protein